MSNLYLAHHGIKGQKWGFRRYQNPDGTLTPEGQLRYRYGTSRYGSHNDPHDTIHEAKAFLNNRLSDIRDIDNHKFARNYQQLLNGARNSLQTLKTQGFVLTKDDMNDIKSLSEGFISEMADVASEKNLTVNDLLVGIGEAGKTRQSGAVWAGAFIGGLAVSLPVAFITGGAAAGPAAGLGSSLGLTLGQIAANKATNKETYELFNNRATLDQIESLVKEIQAAQEFETSSVDREKGALNQQIPKSSGRYTTGSKETSEQMMKRLESDPDNKSGAIPEHEYGTRTRDISATRIAKENPNTAYIRLHNAGYRPSEIAKVLGQSTKDDGKPSGETRKWAEKYKVNKNDISSLKARQNRARYLQSSGNTIAEIADIMGAPVSSIKDYLYEDFDSLR